MTRVILLSILLFTACRHHSKYEIIESQGESSLRDELGYLNELVEDKNANYQAYFKRSEVYYQLNDYRKALIDIKKSLELNSKYEEAYLLESQIYFRQEKYDRCINAALQAELRGLRNYELYELLAIAYLKEGEVESAQKSIQRLLDFNRSAENLSLKGDIYLQLKDTTTSIKSYEQALTVDSTLIRPYKALYEIFISKNVKKAESYIDNYLEIDSMNADFLIVKATRLAARGAYDSAILNYKRAEYQKFNDPSLINNIAMYYYELDSIEVSKELARTSVVIDSVNNREALLLLARCYDELRDYVESKNYYNSLLQIDSTDVIAAEELDKLNRKIAYLWRLERQKKAFDSIRNSAPPVVERKDVNQ